MNGVSVGIKNSSSSEEEEVIDMAVSIPLSTFTTDGENHTIDSQLSTWNGNETGGAMGIHTYNFSGIRNDLDILANSTPLTLVAGANVEPVGDGFEKSSLANTWDSWFSSQESFDPAVQDFAISWAVESTTGTIREMIGLDSQPSANASYTSIEFAAYQVNGNFYSYVYEKGSSIITGAGDVAVNVGDRIGIKCIDGVVTYFIQSGSLITDIYTSKEKATSPMFLKAALNRGKTSSGAAVVTDCASHTGVVSRSVSTSVSGLATEIISDSDKDNLSELGFIPSLGSTYSMFKFSRPTSQKFPSGLDINYSHFYYVSEAQDVQTITL